ncbi:DUF2868 domain-containing protein [Marinobacter sp. CA1]|uniref:DUF2868 domain-containing protein n=1 Tax=Marinobacter sp. CA1 TaxID=2817656 RepID=UPI001D065E33|nr:DUF2868 domain-containing protein [Marinobacter sp. CA1]UDL04982.1 DUF2868 domain-containing protein [Marinobacter sp. CA1]
MTEHPLTRLLAFDDQVRRDRRQAPAFLHRRDRRFGLDTEARDDDTLVNQWLTHLRRFSPGSQQNAGGRDRRLQRWDRIGLAFMAAGVLLGITTMLGLLYYDGSGRINVTVLLAFLALQLLLALATAVQSLLGWRPWGWLVNRSAGADTSVLQHLHPQLLARAAQGGGLAFTLAGLATLLVLVVVQDLAFGWSTTLAAGAESYHRLVQTLAIPWQALWPAAVPDANLVASTRFFRAAPTSAVTAVRWGDWWPFLTMAWLCYGVLPRALLRWLAGWHLRHQARQRLYHHPGLTALRYRMETPVLETGNPDADASSAPSLDTRGELQPYPDSPVVIRWAGAGGEQLPLDFADNGQRQVFEAGGGATLAQDRLALRQAAAVLALAELPSAIVLTRAWEPPTGELEDFLSEAREQWPTDTLVALVPLATDPSRPPEPQQLAQWLRFSQRQHQARLQVSRYDAQPPARAWSNGGAT